MALKTKTNFSHNSGTNYIRLPKEIFDDSLFSQFFDMEDGLSIELTDGRLIISKEGENGKENR